MATTSRGRSLLWAAGGLPLGALFAYAAQFAGLEAERINAVFLGLPAVLVLVVSAALWRWAAPPLAVTFCAAGLATLAFFAWLFSTLPPADF